MSCRTNKGLTVKFILIFLLCASIYVYLYSKIAANSLKISNDFKDTLKSIKDWKRKIHNAMSSEESSQFRNLISQTKYNIGGLVGNTTIDSDFIVSTKKSFFRKKTSLEKTDRPILTLFTTWSTSKEKYTCHNNTIRNWKALQPLVQPVIFTNEPKLTETVNYSGWLSLPVRRFGGGVPILKYMFLDAMRVSTQSHFYAFSNGDILYTQTLTESLLAIMDSPNLPKNKHMLIVGRRTNVNNVSIEEAGSLTNVTKTAKRRGELFTTWAEDYFITSVNYPWAKIPEVVIGRRAYDNWLVLNARNEGHITIDASETLIALHQTTKSGNLEGHHAQNANYNVNLLSRLYNQVQFGAGMTSCTKYFTKYNVNGQTEILKRKQTLCK